MPDLLRILLLAQGNFGLGLEPCQRGAQLVRCVCDKTLLLLQRLFEARHQVVHGFHHGLNFPGGVEHIQRCQIAMRTRGNFLPQRMQRRQAAPDPTPHDECRNQDHQQLRQHHADHDLVDHGLALGARFPHLDHCHAIGTGTLE
ncbi:hypothetical protein GALL_504990 [mine drainage metagenome]|uniref:Uncharacterized protein n=1 Tax=mine drainage metagenome TaxID=410659 RepID=A0A1J5PB16_9ZZZZ